MVGFGDGLFLHGSPSLYKLFDVANFTSFLNLISVRGASRQVEDAGGLFIEGITNHQLIRILLVDEHDFVPEGRSPR